LYYRAFKGESGVTIPDEYRQAVARADHLEELIQNNALQPAIQSGVETMTELDIAALKGLWRGRGKAEREKDAQS
jgi:hypothetical protein